MRHTFPQDEGWQVGERLIRLSQLTINYLTKLFSKPSYPPNCEAKWNYIVGFDLPWDEIWASLGTFLTNPKDEYSWLRFLHRRRLYISDNSTSNKCKCCKIRYEHLRHFPFCTGMRSLRALVRRFLRAMGYDTSTHCNNNPLYFFGFQLDANKVMIKCKVTQALIRLFWRVTIKHYTRISTTPLSPWYVKYILPGVMKADLARSLMSKILTYQLNKREFFLERLFSPNEQKLPRSAASEVHPLGRLQISNGFLVIHPELVSIFKEYECWTDFNA